MDGFWTAQLKMSATKNAVNFQASCSTPFPEPTSHCWVRWVPQLANSTYLVQMYDEVWARYRISIMICVNFYAQNLHAPWRQTVIEGRRIHPLGYVVAIVMRLGTTEERVIKGQRDVERSWLSWRVSDDRHNASYAYGFTCGRASKNRWLDGI